MAFSLRNSSDRDSVGLDIDAGFLAAVAVSHNRIHQAASTDLPAGLVRDGEVIDPEGLGAAMKQFVTDARLPKRVRLGVSNQQIVVRMIELPPIADAGERALAVRFQAAEAIAMPLEDAVLDYQVIERVEVDGAERDRIVVVAARASMIEQILDAAGRAGLKVEGIDLDAFALVRALAGGPRNPDLEVDDARVYCHIGGMTNLAIAAGDTCVFTRPLSTVSEADDGEIASALAEEIRLSIDSHLNQPGARRVGDVVLSGMGARREELVWTLKDLIGRPVEVAPPFGGLEPEGVPPGEDPHRYTVAAGLALGAAA